MGYVDRRGRKSSEHGEPRRTGLQAELTVLEQELTRLTAAVAQGGDLKPTGFGRLCTLDFRGVLP